VEDLGFLDFIVGSIQVKGGSSNLGLEFNLLSLELFNSLLVVNNSLVLIGSQSVDGVDDFISEILQHGDNLAQKSLVGEVLLGSQ